MGLLLLKAMPCWHFIGLLLVGLLAKFDMNNWWTWIPFLFIPYLYFGYIRPEKKSQDAVAKNYDSYVRQIEEMNEYVLVGPQSGNEET